MKREDGKVIIATRGSKLALWQANHVKDRLRQAQPELDIELLTVKTKGDRITNIPLAKIGGKALFVKEIEQALLDGRADIAVHSMKDVPAELAPGLHMAAVSEREDARDAWVSRSGQSLAELPAGAVVGTSSMRRQCQVLAARPDVEVRMLRGNVPTRLGKLDAGEFDAIILAAAGLMRLGFGDRITETMSPELSLPAVGQGALGIETRTDDGEVSSLVHRALHHPADARRVAAERAYLLRLEGSCQTPLAAHATYVNGDSGDEAELEVVAMIGRPDGSEVLRATRRGPAKDAEDIGLALAEELLARGGDRILEELRELP